jgi:CheY-like chemotaxis protein/polyhydroxyalkanoate synthesis regulator phasin
VSKRKLLLADDSVTIQKIVNLSFAEEGIEVITAADGNSAMEKFVEFAPDLVMVDVSMPGFDGYRICEMIKQDEETKQIPVILLVGSFEPFDEAEARRVGADDYLTKPFQSIRQLVSRVSDLLDRSNGGESSYNQDNFSSGNQAAEATVNNFGETSRIVNEANFEPFDDAGMDDEMIQTNQIGSLPADESQKFVSEPNIQTSENNFANQDADEKEEVSVETQHSTAEYFQRMQVDSAEDEILWLDEKIFEFADEQPVAQKTEEFGEKKDSPETANFSPEIIEAIAKKVMEKLSDKVIKEIAREITPQRIESVIKEIAQKKTN